MFFYDAIPKYNYDKELLKTINNFFQGKSEIRKKIHFQFVFITSSYLAFNFKNLKDKIDELENEISSLKVKNTGLETKVKSLTEKNSNLETNVKDLTLVVNELRKKVNELYQYNFNNIQNNNLLCTEIKKNFDIPHKSDDLSKK